MKTLLALGAALAVATPSLAQRLPTELSGSSGRNALAKPADSTAELAQVQAHLRALDTMTADFSQTDVNGKTLTGTLTMKRPGRIRFQYQKGVPLLIVGDGKALTMIDYQVAQVSRWPIGNSPLSILLDPNKDIARYVQVVRQRIGGQLREDPTRLLISGRDPKHPEFGTITIGFQRTPAGPAGLVLAGWTVEDAQGGQTTTVLRNQRFGQPVADNNFTWRDPRPTTRR